MSDNDEDFSGPFWCEDPTVVVDLFVTLLRQTTPTAQPVNTKTSANEVSAPTLARSTSAPALATSNKWVKRMLKRNDGVRSARIQLANCLGLSASPAFSSRSFVFPSLSARLNKQVRVRRSRRWVTGVLRRVDGDSVCVERSPNKVRWYHIDDVSVLDSWDTLHLLCTCLQWKERVHLCYVKTGLYVKRALKGLVNHLNTTHDSEPVDFAGALHLPAATIREFFTNCVGKQRMATAVTEFAHQSQSALRERAMFANFDAPYYVGQGAAFTQNTDASDEREFSVGENGTKAFHGLACSAGTKVVEGVCRICKSLADAKHVRPGEILVVEHTGMLSCGRARGLICYGNRVFLRCQPCCAFFNLGICKQSLFRSKNPCSSNY